MRALRLPAVTTEVGPSGEGLYAKHGFVEVGVSRLVVDGVEVEGVRMRVMRVALVYDE